MSASASVPLFTTSPPNSAIALPSDVGVSVTLPVIPPLLMGLSRPVQICPLAAGVSTILNMATFAAYEAAAYD